MQTADKQRVVLIALAAASALWAVALVAGPWVAAGSRIAGGLLYAAGGLVCHQRPERSFHLAAAQLPVCARCLGLYLGAAVGLASWVLAHRGRREWVRWRALRALGIAAVPTAVTVGSAWLGLGDPVNGWRSVLAFPLGIVAGRVVGAVTTQHLK